MASTQKITPNLWFNGNAKEAVDFYCSVFPGSSITSTHYYPKSAAEGLVDFQKDLAGKVLTMEFTLAGHNFMAINAGPEFTPTPASSTMVNFDPSKDPQAREHLNQVWQQLMDGGTALMPLQKYDFSEYYGWVQDRYGFSWQLILTRPEGEERPCMIPSFLFGQQVQNHAKEAIDYYIATFKDSRIGTLVPYTADNDTTKAAESVMFADFQLAGQWFTAMDSGAPQDFTFSEAVSYAVACADQAEIDALWERLSAVPASEQCGWCKDKFGVSWQIVPANMGELMQKPGAYANMMQMKKIIMSEF